MLRSERNTASGRGQARGNLRSELAEVVSSFLRGSAFAVQETRLRLACSALESLFQIRVEGCDGWGRSCWVDGILPAWTYPKLSLWASEIRVVLDHRRVIQENAHVNADIEEIRPLVRIE